MQGLTHDDSDILHRVVFVDIDVALGLDRQIEESMFRHQLQHMVEEPDACVDLPLATAIQCPGNLDVGFLRGPVDRRLPMCHSFLHENLLWADFAWASNPSMWANRTR